MSLALSPRSPPSPPLLLRVPPLERPRCIPEHVFDAWGWCASDTLEWRRPEGASTASTDHVDEDNPPELLFVVERAADASFLPLEHAILHAKGYGFDDDDRILAPWAIDDATDLFFERRVTPRDVLWLGAPTLRALVWGLHDWVHFHNHGPFDEPAWTELACDLVALQWLRLNKDAIELTDARLAAVAADLAALSATRFAREEKTPPTSDLTALFGGAYPG